MAVIVNSTREFIVPSRCLVGRSALAELRLRSKRASSEHASLGWHAGRWILRDLGSSNGTCVDGKALSPHERVTLSPGHQLRFGDDGEVWTATDLAAPAPCAVQLGSQTLIWGEDSLLVLPTIDAPEASVYRVTRGWFLDAGAGAIPLECGDIHALPSGYYRMRLPEQEDSAQPLTIGPEMEMAELDLSFVVGPDGVTLRLEQGPSHVQLPARACLHTLLALARQRLETDADGWISPGELAELRSSSPEKINVDIHRIRKMFQDAGVRHPAQIVERDGAMRLRIGTSRVRETRE